MINLVAADTVEQSLVLEIIYKKRRLFARLLGDDDLSDGDELGKMRGEEVKGLL